MGPVDLFLFAQPLDFVLLEQVLKDHAMQIVEFGPRNLALAHFVHRRPVPETPAGGEPRPVNIQALGLAPTSSLGNHGTAPVHDGAEYIEDACLHLTNSGFTSSLSPAVREQQQVRNWRRQIIPGRHTAKTAIELTCPRFIATSFLASTE